MLDQPAEIVVAAYVVVFLGALLAFEGLRQFLSRDETTTEARNRRMKLVRSGATSERVLQELFYHETRNRRGPRLPDLKSSLRKAGLRIGPVPFVAGAAVFAALMFLMLRQNMPQGMAALMALAIGLLAPYAVVTGAQKRRMDKLVSQLPDALDMMARGLKVGHPLNVTVASVAREMPDPIGSEFGLVEDQVSFGADLVDAFTDLADRTGVEDTRSLAVSVGIQHGTGGNLARVLNVLATVIRDRATMRRKIMALSAEGRLSAFILSCVPFGIVGAIHATTPTFYGDVAKDPLFLPAAITVGVLIAANALILRYLVTFKF